MDEIEVVLDRTRPGWRERAERRKSPWNLVGVLILFAIAGVSGVALFRVAWRFHLAMYPEHAGQLASFGGAGISLRAFVPSVLLTIPLLAPSFTLGAIGSNLILWLIPPARRALDAEAGTDPAMTFTGANIALLKWGGLVSLAALVLSALGAATLQGLK